MVQSEEQFGEEEELRQEPSTWARVFRGVVALVLVGGLVYLSGVYQYFFFQRTSPHVQQEQLQTATEGERIVLPLTVFVLQNNDAYGSRRTREEAEHLVEQADRIWEQAGIDFHVQQVYMVEMSDKQIEVLYEDARRFAALLEQFDAGSINVVLAGKLQGLNGVSFGGIPLVAVADYTTVFDFRALAHEIGHQLGLPHVKDETRLMYQGANGFSLSLQEISSAREFAKQFQ